MRDSRRTSSRRSPQAAPSGSVSWLVADVNRDRFLDDGDRLLVAWIIAEVFRVNRHRSGDGAGAGSAWLPSRCRP